MKDLHYTVSSWRGVKVKPERNDGGHTIGESSAWATQSLDGMLSAMGDTTDSLASLMAKSDAHYTSAHARPGNDTLTLESAEGEGEGGGGVEGGGDGTAVNPLTEEEQAQEMVNAANAASAAEELANLTRVQRWLTRVPPLQFPDPQLAAEGCQIPNELVVRVYGARKLFGPERVVRTAKSRSDLKKVDPLITLHVMQPPLFVSPLHHGHGHGQATGGIEEEDEDEEDEPLDAADFDHDEEAIGALDFVDKADKALVGRGWESKVGAWTANVERAAVAAAKGSGVSSSGVGPVRRTRCLKTTREPTYKQQFSFAVPQRLHDTYDRAAGASTIGIKKNMNFGSSTGTPLPTLGSKLSAHADALAVVNLSSGTAKQNLRAMGQNMGVGMKMMGSG